MIQLPSPRERNLFFTTQVTQASISQLTQEIININETDAKIVQIYEIYGLKYEPKPIKLYIDSYGGYVYQCFGLLEVMDKSKTPIHTIVTGAAMSCGFLMAITGHKRFAYEKATLMYHQVSSGAVGKLKEMEEEIIETKRLQKMIETHTLRFTTISKERLQKAFDAKEDWFIDAKEALKLGAVDEIIK